MLVQHPTIYVDASGSRTDALLVRNGEVVAVGDEARTLATAEDRVVEPTGACVFPALCDAHIHMWGLGLRPGSVSLGDVTETSELYARLAPADVDASPAGWVLGRDWDQHQWEDNQTLDIQKLDALFGDTVPVVLRRIDGHALWVNNAALRVAGIDDAWDPGPNGHVGRGPNGLPNGLLVDDAMNPVLEVIPEPSMEEDQAVFLQTCELLINHGCSAAHIAWMPLDRMQMLTSLRDAGELPLRLHLLLDGRDPELADELALGPRLGEWINIAGVKFFADGALGSQGAHLRDPYPDGSHGLVLETRDKLIDVCPSLAARGWQVAIHAIGDAATTSVLDAYEAIDAADRDFTRPRIEHCQMVSDEDLPRFRELSVTASIQAIHMYSDAAWAPDALTTEQLDELFRWRELHDASPCTAGGSDYPIEDPNPWHGIATSSSRLDRLGREFRGAQRISRIEALRSYTDGAAWSSFREDRCGKLLPGFLADFIVLDRDPFDATNEEIWDMRVQQTWVGGKRRADNTPT